jgi:hypothetical protein
MKKPDNQRNDLEALRRQLRQEFKGIALELIEEKIDLVLLDNEGITGTSSTDDNPEDGTGDDDDDDKDKDPAPAPFVEVKFRNNNGTFTRATESNSFGDILVASDGTATVNVVGRIFDDTPGIESYKIRIKRID